VVTALLAAAAGVALGTRGPDAPWACSSERLGLSIVDGFGADGYPTELEAVRAWIPILADDGTVPADRLRQAFASSTGPTRYDVATGGVRVDGDLVVAIHASRNPDGTWSVGSYEQCMRPPSAG
jgi:hypothetical protein